MNKDTEHGSERKTAEKPRWDNWHVRLPNPKDQQRAIELFQRSGGKNKVGFRAWAYSWREFQGHHDG